MLLLKWILYIFSSLAILTVLLPLIRKDHWVFRIFDYPRMQKFFIIVILLVIWILFFRATGFWFDRFLISSLGIAFLHLFYIILPFTFLGKKMIDKISSTGQKKLNILVANVYQYNSSHTKLLQLVKKRNPDIVFLVETDNKWLNAIKDLRHDYPYYIEIPKENTYGLLFYSKLPITYHTINYLIDSEIPSIIADVEFDSKTVKIFGLHPAPPVPHEKEYSTDRDAEILMVGKMVKEHCSPCLVIGDLNDVAWSYTTKLFLKTSGMLDPRRGRGIYSTFNAKYLLLRWPLDHYFVSSHFRLAAMKVETHIDSDHFPISISLVLSSKDDKGDMETDKEEKELVEKKIEAGLEGKPL